MADPYAAQLPDFDMQRDAILRRPIIWLPTPTPLRPMRLPATGPGDPVCTVAIWLDRRAIIALLFAFAGGAWAYTRIKSTFPARARVERLVMAALLIASFVAIITTVGLLLR